MPLNPVEIIGGLVIGEGVGQAVGDVVAPQLQSLKNSQWAAHPHVPPDVMALAEGVAREHLDFDTAKAAAALSGFGDAAFLALVTIARTGPGSAYAFELWRRGKIGETAFRRALKRTGMEDAWIDALVEVKQQILSAQELAVMVQRGVVPDPGYLPVGPPGGRGVVTPMPVAQIDTAQEAAGSGYDHERMAALTRIIGLPASPDLAARMVFRKIIERVDFDRAIAEGNTRNEWRDPLFEGFRQIPTAHDGVEGRLRGWIDDDGMYAETARHGMSKADTDLLFKITGRPLSFHQVFIGLRRGGTYDGPIGDIDPAFLKALRESNIRPEWYSLAWAQRHSYPSPFVLRALTEAKDLTREEAHQILLYVGWPTDLAAKVSTRWATQETGGGSSYVGKAQTQLWATTHAAYVARLASQADVQTSLDYLGIAPADQGAIIEAWSLERDLNRAGLTKAEIKKAYAEGKFTHDVALARLEALGYSFEDANTLLDL